MLKNSWSPELLFTTGNRRSSIFPMRRLVLAAAVAISACAPKVVPAPVVTAPKFPDFVQPSVPDALAGTRAAENQRRGWAFLQGGDFRMAEREFSAALKAVPAFYPAEVSLGYMELARNDAKAALPHFDKALEISQQPGDLSTVLGRGQALLALDREREAASAFEAALAIDPSLTDIRRRVEVLKFRIVERNLEQARQAARAGRLDEAMQAYTTAIASSPDSAFLYRELAGVERQKGSPAGVDAALEHFRKAVALDPTDARSLAQVGEILDARDDFDGAAKAYVESLALEPNADLQKRLDVVRARAELAKLPAEFRAIDQAPQITRADLAALIGIRLRTLLSAALRPNTVVITDVRGHWAATWIMAVARAGVMEPYANHAFQPRSVVRRTDLAQAVARLLPRAAAQRPDRIKAWESARLKFSDLSASHLAYPAASAAVASGVLGLMGESAFQPSRPVTGAEAADAIARLEALAGLR
jgi:tetratricopeptide (TPR) repeat protein